MNREQVGIWTLSAQGQHIVELLQDTSRVVDEVNRRLPKEFPARIADTVLAGLRDAAERLGGMVYRSVDMR